MRNGFRGNEFVEFGIGGGGGGGFSSAHNATLKIWGTLFHFLIHKFKPAEIHGACSSDKILSLQQTLL